MDDGERLRVGDWCWLRSAPMLASGLEAGDLVEITSIDGELYRISPVLKYVEFKWVSAPLRLELFYRATS